MNARERYQEVLRDPSDIRDHLPRLRREARGTVLELGVREGNSTAALLAGIEDSGGAVWSVDVTPECRDLFDGHPHWRFVCADSRDTEAVEAAGLPADLDVLFVDTIHTYEQVRDELAVWAGRVRPGGILLFHDTDSFPEIRRAIAEWCRSRRVPYEFLPRSNGLGVAYPGRGGAFGVWLRFARAWRGALRVLKLRWWQFLGLALRIARKVRRILLQARRFSRP